MSNPWIKKAVLAAIPIDAVISYGTLLHTIGVSSTALGEIIRELREEGVIICAYNGGYYRTEDPEKLFNYYCALRCRASATLSMLRSIKERLVKAGIDMDTLDRCIDEKDYASLPALRS